jgi:Cdc6-like AAA superfamily ATPase
LIIISISNLLNITNQLLPKIASRFGQNKILFKPYNKEQIRIIIKYKGIDLQIFDEDAIKLSSMKVAAINGDLRRIIVILHKAHELFLNDNKNKIYDNNKLINKFYIIRACNELYDQKMINVLKNFKITEKMVISAILLKNIKDNNNSIKLEDLYDSLQIFVFKFNETNLELDINWDDFQKIIYNLLRIKIIELDDKTFINFKDNYIHIKFYVDEFMLACQYDEEYKPIYEFLSNLLI